MFERFVASGLGLHCLHMSHKKTLCVYVLTVFFLSYMCMCLSVSISLPRSIMGWYVNCGHTHLILVGHS